MSDVFMSDFLIADLFDVAIPDSQLIRCFLLAINCHFLMRC